MVCNDYYPACTHSNWADCKNCKYNGATGCTNKHRYLKMEYIEMPFEVKDSKFHHFEYTIPEGYTATIEDGKAIVKKAESEDERIRKALLAHFSRYRSDEIFLNFPMERIVAWVEKQKEQETITDSVKFEEGFKAGREFERREQKPVEWSEEDEETIHLACEFIRHRMSSPKDTIGGIKYEELIKRLKFLRPQPKQEWNEEDEKHIKVFENLVDGYNVSENDRRNAIFWLKTRFKSICSQSKVKWNEEDKRTVNTAIYWLERRLRMEKANDITTDISPLSMRKTVERLKSLRPSWKPSEEQMDELKKASEEMCGYNAFDVPRYPKLKSLDEQLRKLM